MKDREKVYGVGKNDADYNVTSCTNESGKRRLAWFCPFYRAWIGMLKRCYSATFQAEHPTYIDCTVTPEWHSFSAFRAWMIEQDWEGKELDKDILLPGNKVYSPETCVFVSGALNNFLIDSGASRGELPIGVCWDAKNKKFRSNCKNPFTGKREHLGRFACPNAAHEAWRRRKHQHACTYADQQTDERIATALRNRLT